MTSRRLLPPIQELAAFESAARLGSFTRAATELNLTQGAISRSIRLLEQKLSIALFERIRQRVVLTGTGTAYLREIQPLLRDLAQATQRTMAAAPGEMLLNLATLPTFAQRWLIPRLPVFSSRFPQIRVNFTTRLVPFDLAEEPFDAVIHHGRDAWAGGETHLLLEEEMLPMCSPGYRARFGIDGSTTLANATLLHQSTRPTAWAQWFEEAGLDGANIFRGPAYDQFGMVAKAAAAGLGVALLPRFLVEEELASGQLEIIADTPFRPGSSYYLVMPQGSITTAAQMFRDWILEESRVA